MTDLELGAAIHGIVQKEIASNQTIAQLAQHANSMSLILKLVMDELKISDVITAKLKSLAESQATDQKDQKEEKEEK